MAMLTSGNNPKLHRPLHYPDSLPHTFVVRQVELNHDPNSSKEAEWPYPTIEVAHSSIASLLSGIRTMAHFYRHSICQFRAALLQRSSMAHACSKQNLAWATSGAMAGLVGRSLVNTSYRLYSSSNYVCCPKFGQQKPAYTRCPFRSFFADLGIEGIYLKVENPLSHGASTHLTRENICGQQCLRTWRLSVLA